MMIGLPNSWIKYRWDISAPEMKTGRLSIQHLFCTIETITRSTSIPMPTAGCVLTPTIIPKHALSASSQVGCCPPILPWRSPSGPRSRRRKIMKLVDLLDMLTFGLQTHGFCLGSFGNLSDSRGQPSIKTSLIVSVAGNCSRNSRLRSAFLLWTSVLVHVAAS